MGWFLYERDLRHERVNFEALISIESVVFWVPSRTDHDPLPFLVVTSQRKSYKIKIYANDI